MGLRSPANASHVVRRFEAIDDSELVDEIGGWKDLKQVDCPLLQQQLKNKVASIRI
tara:strand:+ start:1773 stop:1940 length:168 start_codon:yes stop_codon:yes gene_type:complete